VQFFSRDNPTITPRMDYGVPEIFRADPYQLGSHGGAVELYDRFGPEPDFKLFQDFLNNKDSIRLDPRKLQIPEPSQQFKSFPGFTPTILPGVIDRFILQGGFGVT